MSDQFSICISIGALVISCIVGFPALVLAIINHFQNKRMSEELFGGADGAPTVMLRWGNPTQSGLLSCRVTAIFNLVSSVSLTVGKEKKTVGKLGENEGEVLEFPAVKEGTKYKLKYFNPIAKIKHVRKGRIYFNK